jgi:hypothetical protein
MIERKIDSYSVVTRNPEAGLTKAEKKIRRELLKEERPIATAAKEIARLRAALAELEPTP